MMDDKFWEKYGALGGIWFAILAVIGGLIGGAQPSRNDTSDIVEWYEDSDAAIQVGGFLVALAIFGIVWWFGSLWRAMGRADPSSNRVGIIAFAGFVFGGATAVAGTSVNVATASRIDDVGSGADFFYSLASVLLSYSSIGSAILVLAVSALALRTGFLPKWLAQAGFVLVAIQVLGSIGVASDAAFFGVIGFIAFLLWVVWIVIIGVLLYQQASADEEAPAAAG